jgi:glycosyltransferase involved in cell wall biosynthesis
VDKAGERDGRARKKRVAPLLLGMGWFPDQHGGLNRYLRDLHVALAERGLSPRAIVLGPAVPAEGVTVAADRGDPLPSRLRRYTAKVRLLAPGAEVADAHLALYALIPLLTGSLRGRPFVTHFHGPWAQEDLRGANSVAAYAKRLVEHLVYRRARELIVLSGAFRRILVEDYRVSPWQVHVVPPGVDLDLFRPGDSREARRALGIEPSAWVVFTVRRLVPRMGVDVLLETWQRLARSHEGALLLVAGDGPLRRELESRAADLAVADSVRFVGRLTDEQLVAYYRAADVCVVPSIALEGFGLVVLEALACGTAVIGSDVGGLPETLARLDPRLVVPARDSAALAERLAAARNGREPLPDADTCRAFAESFSWRHVAARHEEIYERAVRRPQRAIPRIVYVDHCARLSGGELALLHLLQALDDVDAHVILGEEGPLVRRLIDAGISVEVLPLARAARHFPRGRVTPSGVRATTVVRASLYTASLARRLRRLRPDLVHTNSLKAALYGGTAGRLAGIPVIWHVRDRVADDYLPSSAVRLVRMAAARIPTAVIANSHATLATLNDGSAVPRFVVPSPVAAPDGFGRQQERDGDRRDALRIGMVGRLAPWKGQHVFLDAFAQAFRDGSERLVIAGAPLFGEDAYEAQLRRRVKALGLERRVDFTGFSEDVWSVLRDLDVLVHASVTPEPFGQVIVEGMAAGLPVVATGAGGPAEIVRDGVDGLLYPPGDSAALAARLRTLAADAGLRARLGAAARETARSFTPDAAADGVMKVYDRVLGEG